MTNLCLAKGFAPKLGKSMRESVRAMYMDALAEDTEILLRLLALKP